MPLHSPSKSTMFIQDSLLKTKFWFSLLGYLLALELLLVVLNIWTPEIISRSIHLDRESNFVVWFSSSQLLLASLTTMLVVLTESRTAAKIPWLLLAALLLALSIDETAMLHESIGSRLNVPGLPEPDSDSHWLIRVAPLAVGGVFLLVWLARVGLKENVIARRLMIAALSCWCLSLILECVQHHCHESSGEFTSYGYYKAVWIAEEFCEMAGASMLWCSLGIHYSQRVYQLR